MTSDFLEEYIEDARDHIANFERSLMRLEQNINDLEALKNIFRSAHSLKGSSYYMGFKRLGEVVHSVENLLEPFVKGDKSPDRGLLDILFKILNFLEDGLGHLVQNGEEPEIPEELKVLLGVEHDEEELASRKDHDNTTPISEGEYDEELLQIYVETIEDKVKELVEIICSSDLSREKLLSGVGEVFDRLISASRYMDFDPVVDVLENWHKEIADLVASSKSPHVLLKKCEGYIGKLKTLIPRLNSETLISLIADKIPPEPESKEMELFDEESEDVVPDLDFLTRQIDEAFDAWTEEDEEKEEDEKELIELSELEDEDLLEFAADEETKEPLEFSGVSEISDDSSLPFVTIEEESLETVEEDQKEEIPAPVQPLRVDPSKVDNLLNKVGELVIRRSELDVLTDELKNLIDEWGRQDRIDPEERRILEDLHRRYSGVLTFFSRLTWELQDSVMKIRMLPLMQLFSRFPRAVREHAQSLGKEVRLVIHGGDTELDRHLLEQLHEPMLHLLRNAVAHGIEHPDERTALGKPRQGTIVINAFYRHQMVFIEIQDDGRGIDISELKERLIQQGVYSKGEIENLDEQTLLDSIFLTGVSTALETTESSGRGIGLDVVRQKCRAINGQVTVETEKGKGTKFTIQIPLTLAIIPALLVMINDQKITLPLSNVVEVYKYDIEKVKKIKDAYIFNIDDRTVPLVFPKDIFPRLKISSVGDSDRYIVLLKTHLHEIALVVDRFLGQQEVVIKPIEDMMNTIRGYAGATILGDGSISLILDVSELVSAVSLGLSDSTLSVT